MKYTVLLLCLSITNMGRLQAQSKTPHKIIATPFQGTKEFCTYLHTSKYTVSIKGVKATITYSYKEYKNIFTGTFRNGKIYTNDPNEKSTKTGGRYYQVTKDMVRVLNIENGDYEEYDICK